MRSLPNLRIVSKFELADRDCGSDDGASGVAVRDDSDDGGSPWDSDGVTATAAVVRDNDNGSR